MRTQTFGALRVVGSVIVVINLIVYAMLLLVISVMSDISFSNLGGSFHTGILFQLWVLIEHAFHDPSSSSYAQIILLFGGFGRLTAARVAANLRGALKPTVCSVRLYFFVRFLYQFICLAIDIHSQT